MVSYEQYTPLAPNNSRVTRSFLFETVEPGATVVSTLSYARVVERTHVLMDSDGAVHDTWQVTEAIGNDGDESLVFDSSEMRAMFEAADVTIQEFDYYLGSLESVDFIAESMPQSVLVDGFKMSAKAKLEKLLKQYGRLLHNPETPPDQIKKLKYSFRDLYFGLSGAAAALNIGADTLYTSGSYAWYGSGRKSRNGGYNAEYTVCSDEYSPDEVDHAEQVEAIGYDKDWPDEFHYPGKIEIRVDPAARIEIIYTPQIYTARDRHVSHATVVQDGITKTYFNQSLSIRLDLDPSAPHGVALDIGRSAYDGGKNGRHINRNSDLLGSVFEDIEPQGSHEYIGFDEASLAEFRNFAERFVVQLDLQHKEVGIARLGRAALLKAA